MINVCIVQGRLACDPEMRQTPQGVSNCTFRIACDRDYKSDKNGDNTDWIPVVVWRQTAEFVSKHFSKGQMIIVRGRWQVRSFTDKEGNKRTSHDLVADNVWFDGPKKDREYTPAEVERNFNELINTVSAAAEAEDDGFLPF